MGKGSSSSSTASNTTNISGANQVSGSGNLSLSGIGEVGNVNLNYRPTDYNSIAKSLDFAYKVNAENADLMNAIQDNSFKYSLASQKEYSNFATDIVDKLSEHTVSTSDKAFNAIGTNTQLMSDAFRSEATQLNSEIIKYLGLIGGGAVLVYAYRTFK